MYKKYSLEKKWSYGKLQTISCFNLIWTLQKIALCSVLSVNPPRFPQCNQSNSLFVNAFVNRSYLLLGSAGILASAPMCFCGSPSRCRCLFLLEFLSSISERKQKIQIMQAGDCHNSYTMSRDLLNPIYWLHENDSVDSKAGRSAPIRAVTTLWRSSTPRHQEVWEQPGSNARHKPQGCSREHPSPRGDGSQAVPGCGEAGTS